MKENPNTPIPLVAYTLKGDIVGFYDDIWDAALKLSLQKSNIWGMLNGVQNRVGNYIFIKKSDFKEGVKVTYESIKRKRKFLESK